MRLLTKFNLASLAVLAAVVSILAIAGVRMIDNVVIQSHADALRVRMETLTFHLSGRDTAVSLPSTIESFLTAHPSTADTNYFVYQVGDGMPEPLRASPLDPVEINRMVGTTRAAGWRYGSGKRYLTHHILYRDLDLIAGVHVPEDIVFAKRWQYLSTIAVGATLLVVAGLFLAFVFSRRITRRVGVTLGALDAIQHGRFEAGTAEVTGNDELSAIQLRINEMAKLFARRANERSAAAKWLEENERRFRDFAESTSDAFWETDADLRYTSFVNPGRDFANMAGQGGVIGRKRGEYIDTLSVEAGDWKTHIDDLNNRRPFRDFQFSGVYPDGAVFHRVSSGVPVFDDNGEFQGYRGTTTDITDRIEAERRLERLVSNVPGMVYQRLIHPDDRLEYVYMSDGARRLFGDDSEKPFGEIAAERSRVHPDDREHLHRAILDSARERKPLVVQFRHFMPDGTVVWLQTTAAAPVVRPDGVLIQDGLTSDITGLKSAEEQARLAEARLWEFMDTASDTLWETDTEHRITWISDPESVRARHFPKIDLTGKRRWEFPGVDSDDAEKWGPHIEDLENRRPIRDFVFSATTPNGRSVYRRISGRPVYNENGDFTGYRGVSSDITQQVEREREARASQQRLIDAIQVSDDGMALFDSDDGLVFVNDAMLRLQSAFADHYKVGARFEDIVSGPARAGLVAAAENDAEEWIRRRLAYHRAPFGPFATIAVEGSYVEIRDERLPDGGSMVRLIDVTGQVTAMNALKLSEERFRGFAESTSDWMWETDTDHRITWISESVVHHSDIPMASVLGKTRWDALGIDLETDEHWQSLVETMYAQERVRNFHYNRLGPDGRLLYRSINGAPFHDEKGNFQGYRGTITDITPLIEAERRAQEAERRFVEAINTADQGLVLVDPEDAIVFANRHARRLFGAQSDALSPGTAFETMLDAYLEGNLIDIPEAERADWKHQWMERHENAETSLPSLVRLSDGRVLEIREERLPDNSTMIFQTDISARVEAEDALRESEQRFRDFAQSSSDWLWETDADFRFVWASSGGLPSNLDITPNDVVGLTRWDMHGIDIETDAHWKSHLEDLLARRSFRDFRYERTAPDGRVLHRSVSGIPYYDPSTNAFLGYRGTTTDITVQVEAEERYRNLIEQSPTPFVIHHGEELVYANPAAVELYGAGSADEIVGRPVTDFVPPADRERFSQRMVEILEDGSTTVPDEQRRIRLDGTEIIVVARGVPIMWNGKRAALGALIDITDRVRAERQYRELIEAAPMPLSVDDGERFIFVNQAFAELVGADHPDAVVGRNIRELAHPDDTETFVDRVRAVSIYRKTLPTAEIRYRRFDGRNITVLSRSVPTEWEGRPAALGIQIDISDRIAAQSALQDSEERFRNLVAGSRQGVLLHVDQKAVFANDALAEMFGYDAIDDIYGLPSVLDLVAPEDREAWRSNREARLAGLDAPESYEFAGLKKDGTRIWVHMMVRVVGWDGNTALQGTMIDMTDRRDAENAIRDSEERFRLLTTTSPVGVFVADPDGNLEYTNEAYQAMSGLSVTAAAGRGWMDAIHPDDRDRVLREWKAGTQTNRPFRTEFRFLQQDDTVIFGIAQAAAQYDQLGGVLNYIGAVTDVTGLKETEQALQTSEERFRMLTSLSPVGVFLTDEEGHVEYVNEALSAMLGMKAGEARGEGWINGIHPDDRRIVIGAWNIAFKDVTGMEVEVRLGHADGRQVWTVVQASPLKAPDGSATGYVGAVTDITDRRNAEEQLRQVQKMDAVGQLTGGIAHDFNNLLAIVQGNLELLKERAPEEDRLLSLIESAYGAAKRGATLNQRLLAFARRQPLRPEKCDINRIVEDMAGLFLRTLGDNIDLSTDFAEALWHVNIDPNGLETAVLNLAINARDAMPDGGSLNISTRNCRYDQRHPAPAPEIGTGQFVQLTVSDTGFGMDTKTLEQAFDPFFTTKGMGKGSGLGLSMVYGFARQSGGHAIIESVPDSGTSITMFFPRETADAPLHEKQDIVSAPSGAGERILVVEDDEDVRDMAVSMFESLNYRTIEASSAGEALQALDQHNGIELLFTDVMLGNGDDGPELARKAREKFPGIRVLFTSGYAKTEVEDGKTIETGALINKPYERGDLARAVRSALDTGRA